MGERTTYAPGTFSYADLSTRAQQEATAFYTALFGWEASDVPIGEGSVYSMMRIGGRSVAAIAPQPEQQRQAGVPPLWQSYVTVASADTAAERAKGLGADVHAGPFDVMQAGRMAVIRDPQGAFVMVWEPRGSIGAELVNVPGALCWNELGSPDIAASESFYGELFGWRFKEAEGSQFAYHTITSADGRSNGGIRELQPGAPPSWTVYFACEDTAATLARVRELGGSEIAGVMNMGEATLAVAADPQGGVFALYAGPLDD